MTIAHAAVREAHYPLSAAQRRLWFIAQLDPESVAYNNAHMLRVRGPLDARRLIAALHAVVARHDALRMRFVTVDGPGSDVVAIVGAAAPIPVPIVDLTDTAADAAVERFTAELARAPFDLTTGPVVRAALVRIDAEHHVLALAVHHIVSDRWSFGVLVRELAALYTAAGAGTDPALPELDVSYGDCSRAEAARAAGTDTQLEYWRGVLAGLPPPLELPLDRARVPVAKNRGAVVALTVPADLARRLARAGAAHKATPFMTYLAAFFTLLQRSTGQLEIVVGTPVAGRGRIEREPLIGLFVNTLPVRITLAADQPFSAVLTTVRAAVLGMLAHADVPFDRLVSAARVERDGNRNPFFDVLFNFHNTPADAAWPSDISVTAEDVDTGTSRIDLALVLRPESDGSLQARFAFSSELFERSTIETFARHFSVLLESIAADPDAPIERLAIADVAEQRRIRDVWSRPDPAITPPPHDTRTLDRLIADTARRTPDAVAVAEDGTVVTYAQLDRHANRLAHALRAHGIDRDARVGVYLERSASAIVAMLAILKSGGAYVPLDPAYPAERTATMLASAGVAAVVARRAAFAQLLPYALPLLDVDDLELAAHPGDVPPSGTDDARRLAYVIFTSGSTGAPKGVGVEHRGLVTFLTRTASLACRPDDRTLLHEALTFDASMLLWAPLISGASIAVLPAGPFSLGDFADAIERHGVNALAVSPALFSELIDERIAAFENLRRCYVGGDLFPPLHAARFVREFPGCRLFNAYGPTEITIAATYHEVLPDDAERAAVPIGRPVAEARVYIVDSQGRPASTGVPGELWIGGTGVARGYINDAELTARRFGPDPFAAEPEARCYRTGDRARWLPDGTIAFMGRLDAQLKIRGFRIEPGEIEAALLQHRAVRQAAVIAHGSGANAYLAAFVERRDAETDEAALRAYLQAKVPPHAVPARIVVLEALPRTTSGKLDRAALRALPLSDARLVGRPPVSELEQQLVAMWERLLDTAPVGVEDDFFALGGHSLLAARMIGEIERNLQTRLPIAALFERPTIAHIAELLRRDPASLNRSAVVAINAGGSAPPLFFFHGSFGGGGYYCLALARRLGPDRPLFAMRPHGVDGDALPPAIEMIARDSIAVMRSVQPHGPYLLGGFCSGGLVAFEIARQLTALGECVDNVVLIDVPTAGRALRTAIDGIGRFARLARIGPAQRSQQRAHLARLARKVAQYSAEHGKRRLIGRAAVAARAAFRLSAQPPPAPAGAAPAAAFAPIAAAWRSIGEGYVARPYRGRVTVLLSQEYGRRAHVNRDQWPAVAPCSETHTIPGEHLTCITTHIATTADAIAAALRAANARA